MENIFERTERLIGRAALQKLSGARVALFGLGGVGSAALEGLCRGGVGRLLLVDGDRVQSSNRNRQLLATVDTEGLFKVEAAAARARAICPDIAAETYPIFYTPETAGQIDLSGCDYIIDAVDMVTAKIELVLRAEALGIPIISCMGTGNKLDPTAFEVTDLYKTSVCPLCRVMRRELSRRGIRQLRVLYSKEEPRKSAPSADGSRAPASISFVPPVAGFILAGAVICDLIGKETVEETI